jgi:hypothetical protein
MRAIANARGAAAQMRSKQMMEMFISRGLLCASLVLGVLGAPASAAERGTFTPVCAERDLQAVALIERQGEVYDASAVLAQAGLTLLQARLNCLAGDEAGALAMYDRVLRVQVVSSHPRN